ncbi:unnamed protein product [Musa textilis]
MVINNRRRRPRPAHPLHCWCLSALQNICFLLDNLYKIRSDGEFGGVIGSR